MTVTRKPVLGLILKGYPRISETFISNEILLLENLGLRIHIFSMRQPRESFCHESVKKIRARVDYLPETLLAPLPRLAYHNARLALKIPGAYGKAIQAAARRFFRTYRSATIRHLLQAGYLVRKLLPESGVTHLHSHFAHSPTSVAMFAAMLSGLPFSFTAHAKDIYTSDPRQLRDKIALSKFVVTCTGYNQRYLQRLVPRGVKTPIHRVYHGIDLDLFAGGGQEAGRCPKPPFRILTVARITRKKGLSTVYRALKILKQRGIAFKHTLIGDGEDRNELLKLISSLGLYSEIQWLGTQPHHVVLEHYRLADLFVLGCEVAPNGDRDGIPNVFMESMAMGVPVIGSRISAIPEIIRDGRTGLLVPPADAEALSDAMIRLLTDHQLRSRVIPEAREVIRKHFDNRVLIEGLFARFKALGL
jgi:glycosyltransferase involved in cell wall biosynthesis